MENTGDMGLNLGGNIEQLVLQKVETIKPHIAIWNEYFTNITFHNLHIAGVTPKDRLASIILGSAETADQMVSQYIAREESLGRQ